MPVISVVDNHGNPITNDKGRINVRVSKSTDDASVDDRFTDNVGHTAWPGGYVGGEVWHNANLYANTRNVNPAYGSAALTNVDLGDAGAPITITLTETSAPPEQCPANSDKVGVDHWFFKVANAVGAHTNTEANRTAMQNHPDWKKCNWLWQNQLRPPTRARVYLPPQDTNGASPWYFDTGDENGPFQLTFRY